jgi:hypothetical protein
MINGIFCMKSHIMLIMTVHNYRTDATVRTEKVLLRDWLQI